MFMLVFFMASQICYAQSATPGATLLKPIVITAPREEDSFSSRTKLESLPGGTSYIAAEEMPGAANLTGSKAFFGTPGLIVQDFFGGNDQPRIQIRGSGLQQNPVERGILVLQNGLPINRADGSYIVGFINPRQAEAIEVYRGYMANRLSANVLGGALNFISPSGITSPNTRMMISGGSFGQLNLSGQAGATSGDFDGLIFGFQAGLVGYMFAGIFLQLSYPRFFWILIAIAYAIPNVANKAYEEYREALPNGETA